MHKCLRDKCNTKKNGQIVNYWLNGFPFTQTPNDSIDQINNRIIYKREKEDENIVPYNPELLKLVKWKTNVQIHSLIFKRSKCFEILLCFKSNFNWLTWNYL